MHNVKKIRFPEIDHVTWEHPADRAALGTLDQFSGIINTIKRFLGLTSGNSVRLLFTASAVKVSDRQFPELHRQIEEASEILDAPEIPEIFVTQNPTVNGATYGFDKPFIVINSGALELLDRNEIGVMLAHELGHALSGHGPYKTILWFLVNASSVLIKEIPGGTAVLQTLVLLLREWSRKSELSADRASLLAVQNPDICFQTLMKTAGGAKIGQMCLEEFMQQAAEYEASGNFLEGVQKIMNVLNQDHPFPVIRLKELKVWHDSGMYQKVLDGEYPKRGDPRSRKQEFREAADQYREDWKNSGNPVNRLAADIGQGLEKAGKEIEGVFKDLFGGSGTPREK
jgi:Zn-dependent protease with chaperone function